MAEKPKWIVPEKLPTPVRVLRRRGEYDECIQEFVQSELTSALISIPGVRPGTLYSQLTKRIKARGLKEKVKVAKRKDKIYLVKI